MTVKCFTFYLPVSCSTGSHIFQFNVRYIINATYACFLITSRNQLLLHSFIVRHPRSCSKFYQVWLISPPFPSGFGNGHFGLRYGVKRFNTLSITVLKAEFWASFHLCFEYSAYALQISFFNALLQTYSWLFTRV